MIVRYVTLSEKMFGVFSLRLEERCREREEGSFITHLVRSAI